MSVVNPVALLDNLRSFGDELEWLEFKENRFEAEDVGRYISALGNGAMLKGETFAYLVFGVRDETLEVVGTKVKLKKAKVGNEPFFSWVTRLLDPDTSIEVFDFNYDDKYIEILRIRPGYFSPIRFKNESYVRIGSVTKPLRLYREKERTLWNITSRFSFEYGIAEPHLNKVQLFEKFGIPELLKSLGSSRLSDDAMIESLLDQKLIIDDYQGGFDATNLLALLAAKDLTDFEHLSRKPFRVITYEGTSKLHGKDDVTGKYGYSLRFSQLLAHVLNRINSKEKIVNGKREVVYDIPEIAIREILANALIHQDLTLEGGPVIEVFSNRIKITNPGDPLVSTDRFIDSPSRSRNEELASYMRKIGYCEERGSGVDRALNAIEALGLPPPTFTNVSSSTVVTIFGPVPFREMSKDDRIRACYQHACLKFEASDFLTNKSLRARFKLSDKQYAQVWAVISDTKAAGLIKDLAEGQAKKNAKYVPFWAS